MRTNHPHVQSQSLINPSTHPSFLPLPVTVSLSSLDHPLPLPSFLLHRLFLLLLAGGPWCGDHLFMLPAFSAVMSPPRPNPPHLYRIYRYILFHLLCCWPLVDPSVRPSVPVLLFVFVVAHAQLSLLLQATERSDHCPRWWLLQTRTNERTNERGRKKAKANNHSSWRAISSGMQHHDHVRTTYVKPPFPTRFTCSADQQDQDSRSSLHVFAAADSITTPTPSNPTHESSINPSSSASAPFSSPLPSPPFPAQRLTYLSAAAFVLIDQNAALHQNAIRYCARCDRSSRWQTNLLQCRTQTTGASHTIDWVPATQLV